MDDGKVFLDDYFKSKGLPSTLADWAWSEVVAGRDINDVLFLAQDRDEWKQRFIGNETRKKAGLPPLNPAEYLANETAYKSLMRNYGLPAGMYDSPDDFANLIGLDVSPGELQGRLEMGVARVQNTAPEVKQALGEFYGIDEGKLLGYVLDPKRGLQELDRQFRAAETGGAARIAGVDISKAYAERLAGTGVDFDKALSGFGQVGQESEAQQRRAFGSGTISSEDLASAVFYNDKQALDRLRRQRAQSLSNQGGGGPLTSAKGVTGLGAR